MQTTDQPKTFAALIQSDKPILVDFFAEWCGPCRMMKPILEELKKKTGDSAIIVKVDVDKYPSIARAYDVQGVPTLALFKQGKLLWRQSGVVSAQQLSGIIRQFT